MADGKCTAHLAWLWRHQCRMVPTPWRAPRLGTTSLSRAQIEHGWTFEEGCTFEEQMRSCGSMTGSMSRLICGVTLAIGGTVTAAIWCLGLAVRGNICRCQRNDATWDRICAVTHLSHFAVLFPRSKSCLCHPRLCAEHVPCSSCAPEDEQRPLLGWLPVMLQ